MNDLHVYDTTLRDGAQQEGLNLSVADKLAIAAHLDELGVGYIEGGWPGANPKDTEFFARARGRAVAAPRHARRVRRHPAPRRWRRRTRRCRALLESGAPVVTLVAKSHLRHVETALRTTRRRTSRWSATPSASCGPRGAGCSSTPSTSSTASSSTATTPWRCCGPRRGRRRGGRAVRHQRGHAPAAGRDVVARRPRRDRVPGSGIHCHNDTGCAVANSLAAVAAGASHVQGTINGYGERTGNADLLTVVEQPAAQAGPPVLPDGRLAEATRIAHAVSEVTNVPPYSRQPYVGASAFAHKAGLHASAIKVDPDLYQHTDPMRVGNDMRMLVSDMAGRASIELKARELGYDLAGQPTSCSSPACSPGQGAGAARLHLRRRRRVVRAAAARARSRAPGSDYFEVESWRVITDSARRRATRCPRRRSSSSPAGRRSSRPGRATARSTRSTTRCGRP